MASKKKELRDKYGPEASPGQLYSKITSLGDISFDDEGGKSVVEQDNDFVKYCKQLYKKNPSLGKGALFSEKHQEAINFLGWRLTAGEFAAGIKGTFTTALFPIIVVLVLAYLFGVGFQISPEYNTYQIIGYSQPLFEMFGGDTNTTFLMLAGVLFGFTGLIIYYIYNYPIVIADAEKNKALTYVPQIVGYMIMSMKLVPNLEKSIEFSAKHGRGKVAKDFKKVLWDFQIGVYGSVSEGLDALAYNWGKYSSELKEALMRIRASVMEPSESRRYQLLDKTMSQVLDSVKGKMEDYARSLNQPSIMLFYMGVLLPLLLIIILPVGSAFSGQPFSRPEILLIAFCGVLPFVAFSFAKGVVQRRPPTYEPPIINDDYMGLPKKWHMRTSGGSIDTRLVFVLILVIGLGISFFVSTQGLPPKFLFLSTNEEGTNFQIIPADKTLEEVLAAENKSPDYYGKKVIDLYFFDISDSTKGAYFAQLKQNGFEDDMADAMVAKSFLTLTSNPKNDPTKYVFWLGAMITIACGASFLLYYRNIYKRKAQLEIMQMEDEFKESMYLIASRMGENKPVENALKHAKNFLPNLKVSERIFAKTLENIELMGMPLETAVFSPVYGAMKGIPSDTLNTAMRLLVDSVSLGVEVASRTLMSLSLQMDNIDKVNKGLKDLVSEVTTTMQTMAIFIAPIVLGITVALQKVVLNTLAGLVSDPVAPNIATDATTNVAGSNVTSLTNIGAMFDIKPAVFKTFATPLAFLLIIGIYVAEIVIIMIYFTTKIQEDNDLLFKINLAKALPIAVLVFVATVYAGNTMISMILTQG
ncbi:MAG: hypothetical protein NTZ73_01295 [Candidatus Diapherotrites archaeon]|nr:hypothetical protein [Candidatus Diapherotrites archaeon]